MTVGYLAASAGIASVNPDSSRAPWTIAAANADLHPLFAERLRAAAHIRVGLEDAPLGTPTSNPALVEVAVADRARSRSGTRLGSRDRARPAQSPATPDKTTLRPPPASGGTKGAESRSGESTKIETVQWVPVCDIAPPRNVLRCSGADLACRNRRCSDSFGRPRRSPSRPMRTADCMQDWGLT